MNARIVCHLLNSHDYEIYKESELVDNHNNVIGFIIVSKCKYCGKIKKTKVITEEGYGRPY